MTSIAKRVCKVSDQCPSNSGVNGFGDRDFLEWSVLLERSAGLYMAPERKSFLVAGLKARMREIGLSSFEDYYGMLSNGARQAEEWSLLIDLLTVHETRFFRHHSSMSLVVEQVVPQVMEKREGFHAWSVGCATGEEVYSLAMLIDDYCLKQDEPRYYGVTGTDISLPALRSARAGVYPVKRLDDIAPPLRDRYCENVSRRHFEISKQLRKRACFAHLNLRDLGRSPFSGFDLIFCQNLLIYMDRSRRIQVADELARRLRPGGVMILGPGELLSWKNPDMEKMRFDDTLAYRRVERARDAI